MKLIKIATTCLIAFFSVSVAFAQDYYLYVAAESDDQVHLLHYNAASKSIKITETIDVGRYPTETEGPHGVVVSPDGAFWYVSIAHGNPYGMLAKYGTATNQLIGTVDLGMFPATMDISPSTGLIYVVNFDLHGEMVPSTVAVVDPESMTVVTEIPTGIMPHGSRVTASGKFQYHVSMMTDELIEIDAHALKVSRKLLLSESSTEMNHNTHHARHEEMRHNPVVKPTWAHPHPTKPLVYVAANGSDEILVVDRNSWEIIERYSTAKAPYNLEVTPDGKLLVVSYKGEGATGIWSLESGKELTKIKNTRKVTHGVVISPDSKFAFVSVEGIGGEHGSVEVIDLETLERVDIVETGKQAGGITFWKQN